MAYTNTLLHVTFDESDGAFQNAVDNSPLIYYVNPIVVESVFNNGWQMATDTSLTSSITLGASLCSIGFWLKPSNPGMVTSGMSTVPLKMHLFGNGTFDVYENTQINNQNTMVVETYSPAGKIESSAYDADIYHYFWLTYDGSSWLIFKDGIFDNGSVVTGTPTYPHSGTMYFNYVQTPTSLTSRNKGIIDDLVILNVHIDNTSDIVRAANMGALYIADSDYTSIDEINGIILMDDPSTVQINSVYANRGNIYIGRTDGKVKRAIRTLWQSRRDFYNEDELNLLTIYSKSDSTVSINNGILEVKNETIRL